MIPTDISPIDPTDPMTPPPVPAPGIAPGEVTAPAWSPARMTDGAEVPPLKYARFGETPNGLFEWATLNREKLGKPGLYNAEVLNAAALTMMTLRLKLISVRGSLKPIQNVLDGSSLQNPEVRDAMAIALDTIREAVACIEGGAN